MMDDEPFELRVGRTGTTKVLAPAGELDLGTTPELAGALAAVAGDDVLLDLRAVTFIDSSGIAVVLEAWRMAGEAGGRLRVVPGPPQVQRVIGMVALDRALEWSDPAAEVRWHARQP